MGKEWYKISEMVEITGYSRDRLRSMYYRPGQRYARKMNPTKRNSPIEFNLPLFQKAEQKDIEMQGRARDRRPGICV